MEYNFLLLYLWLLALVYMLPFIWNTHYSYVVFLSVFHVHHIPFVHLSPYSPPPPPTPRLLRKFLKYIPDLIFHQCSQFSIFFTLIHYEFGCCIFYSLKQHFPLIFTSSIPISMSQSFLFLSYITLFHFIQIFFNFRRDANLV